MSLLKYCIWRYLTLDLFQSLLLCSACLFLSVLVKLMSLAPVSFVSLHFHLLSFQHLLNVFTSTCPGLAGLSRSNCLLSLGSHPPLQRIRGSHTFSSFSFLSLTQCIIEQPIAVQSPVAAHRSRIDLTSQSGPVGWNGSQPGFSLCVWNRFFAFDCGTNPGDWLWSFSVFQCQSPGLVYLTSMDPTDITWYLASRPLTLL